MLLLVMQSLQDADKLHVLACSCMRGGAVDNVEHHLPGGRGPGP